MNGSNRVPERLSLTQVGRLMRATWLALAALMVTGCVTQVTSTKAIVDVNPVEKPFLWQVKKGPQQAWLFGTIHVGVDAERELPKDVWNAFKAADCFVMEANPSDITMSEIAKFAYLPDGQRLSKMLSPTAYGRLKERLSGTLPESLLDRAQPWFVSLLLLRSGETNSVSMDAAMLARARQSGKKIFFLEDWRDALKDFAAVTTAADLEDMISEDGRLEKDLEDLTAAYRSGQEDKLSAILDRVYGQSRDSREKLHRLIDQRNQKWMPTLTAALDGHSCFVAVGAGHYFGDRSLKVLLDESGWLVL
jgi:hypothetical protein